MTNNTPPRACLSDFASVTLDSSEPITFDVQLGHGTVEFKSPERFNPQKFGVKYPLVTREADIYAFGMTSFQVLKQQPLISTIYFSCIQVLTGETPFSSLPEAEVIESVVDGLRPPKPEDALAIGFSNSLWDFVQLCWDSDRTQRPTAAEVVKHLHEAAVDWRAPVPAISPGSGKNEPKPVTQPGSPSFQPTNSNDPPLANG